MNEYATSIDWWRPAGAGTNEAPNGRLAFRALLALLFILFLSPQSFFPALAPLRIALLAALAGILAHVVDRYGQGRPLSTFNLEFGFTAALLGWAILTLPLSYWPGGSVSLLLDLYLKTVTVFWLLGNVIDTRTKLHRTVWIMALMGIPLAATAVANFASGAFQSGVGHPVKRILGYESALTENPNDLALMLNLILPLSVGLLLASRRPVVRIVLILSVTLSVLGVLATFSRAGFLTLAVTVLGYAFRLGRRGRPGFALGILAVALCGALLLPGDYRERLATIVEVDADPTGSAQARRDDTIAAVRFLVSNPLIGAGVGMNILALNEERGSTWKAVHNAYLEYGVDLGLPGLMLFLLLVAACFRSVRSVQRECAAEPDQQGFFRLAEAVEVSLVAFCFAALFHPVAYQFYFYLLAGLAVALRSTCDREACPAPGRRQAPERPSSAMGVADPRGALDSVVAW